MIYLVRHPESESNKFISENKQSMTSSELNQKMLSFGDPNITDIGKTQANITSLQFDHLENRKVNVYCSGMIRTRYLADKISNRLDNGGVVMTSSLNEYNIKGKNNTFEKDKSFSAFVRRVMSFYDECLQGNSNDIIVVGHGIFISTLISWIILRDFQPKVHQEVLISQICKKRKANVLFHLLNCSITTLDSLKENMKILHIGSYAHLSEDIITG